MWGVMKKKIYSVITAVMILFACIFASACGDKYKNMEFKVLYAFSQDSKDWIDGSDGISLNYSQENIDGEGGETSLVFNEGVATLYVKIEIKNIKKKKYVDSITVSFASFSGLNFSSKRVHQNEIFEVPITGNVDTVMKLYENNSGKTKELPFEISRELEAIEADLTIKPAIAAKLNSSLSLLSLNNLQYLPLYQTNQIGVTYEVAGIGRFIQNGEDIVERFSAEQSLDYVAVENGVLKILDPGFYGADACVIKIKAVSIFHDGSDGEDPISQDFYVYVVEGDVAAPVVRFETEAGKSVDQLNIYENGGAAYSTSTIYVAPATETIYNPGINTYDGIAKYSIAIYVLNEQNQYEKYEFGSSKHQAGINGLMIENSLTNTALTDNQFKFSIATRSITKNEIKIVYEIEELDFSFTQYETAFKHVYINKSALPTCITVNDSLDLVNGAIKQDVVYGTESGKYKGLELKLAVNPNDDPDRLIELFNDGEGLNKNGLIVVDENGYQVSKIRSGKTVFVKFKKDVNEKQTLTIKVSKDPNYYNGETILSSNYIEITYVLTKLVTADSIMFVDSEGIEFDNSKTYTINAESDDNIYVKIYYSGVKLDGSTVVLASDNDAILFNNEKNTIDLSMCQFTTGFDDNGRYDIYTVPIKRSNGNYKANITVKAGNEAVDIKETINVSSVYVVDESETSFVVTADSANIKQFSKVNMSEDTQDAYNEDVAYFAIPKGEFGEFNVADSKGQTKTIESLKFENQELVSIRYINVVSNSKFDITAEKNITKTQILKLVVSYYVLDEGKIVLKSNEKEIQVAVYDGIGNIVSHANKSEIGFLNSYFTETSEFEATVESFASNNYSTPASEVSFVGIDEKELKAKHASQIKIALNDFDFLKPYANSIVLKFVSGGTTPIEVNLWAQKETILTIDDTDYLNGKIIIKLLNNVESIKQISITVTALRFGVVSNVINNISTAIVKVDKADRILVSGNSLDQTSDESKQLNLSFINVADGGYAQASFNANLQFSNPKTNNSIRFEDIETALTHSLYKYHLNEFGELEINSDGSFKTTKIQKDFLNIVYVDGVVTVRAYKNLGGGLFKLVLATKDSYNSNLNPNNFIVGEEHFNTKYVLTINVEDGINSAFSIKNEQELKYINNNLDKSFVLKAHLDLRTLTDFAPLGWFDNTIHPFQGSLFGVAYTPINKEESVETAYSITMEINSSALSTEYGTLYGLFAILGENAIVRGLTINAYFSNYSSKAGELKVAALAGVNKGKISKVDVNIFTNENQDNIILDQSADTIDFGGIVGLNLANVELSKVKCVDEIKIKSNVNVNHNIGLISGTNDGIISGTYYGKQSLNDFVFDIVANITVENNFNAGSVNYFIGSVVGYNTSIVKNMLVGGKISTLDNSTSGVQIGYVGGIVGASLTGKLENLTALSLDLITISSQNLNVAGIVGSTSNSIIDNVKYVSVLTEFNGFDAIGTIHGSSNVAGVVANSTNGSIVYASVESFVEIVDNEIYGTLGETFYTIQNGSVTAGLVALSTGTSVDKSFVKANIKSENVIKLTSDTNELDTYFIGKTNKAVDINKTTYSLVNGLLNGSEIIVSSYMTKADDIDETTQNWQNVYNFDGTKYTKAESFEQSGNYYLFNVEAWEQKWTGFTSPVWELKENYNVAKIKGVDFFFPYLIGSYDENNDGQKDPLMIVAPNSISASFDQEYITTINSVYVIEYNFESYNISETLIVNYLSNVRDENNTHKLISSNNDGLLDVTLLPDDAQGLYKYEILGAGRSFAYINDLNEIVFTGVSGSTPILVRIYSGFNEEIEVFVAIYTQHLFSSLTLNASSIKYVGYQYEIDAYSGQSNIIVTLGAENIYKGSKNATILDVYNLSQYLSVEGSVVTSNGEEIRLNGEETWLDVNIDNYTNMTISIKDKEDKNNEVIPANYSETITFSLCLSKDYFGQYEFVVDDLRDYITSENGKIILDQISLDVNLFNSAKSITVNGEDAEKTTHDDISFDVYLTTDYVDLSKVGIEELVVDNNGKIVFKDNENRDGIKIAFEILEGEEILSKHLTKNGLNCLADLFDLKSAVITNLYKNDNKVIGYLYNVKLEIKNNVYYRLLEDNIRFNIVVYAASNDEINTETTPIDVVLKPTTLQTARIENYKVETLNVHTDYTDIITNKDIQTSIVQPGSLGNVMVIYLEPAYSQVKSVSIKTSELFVPSLGKTVKMKFTQLALDHRGGKTGLTTLYGADINAQVDDTLELKLVSEISESGERVYNGVIRVYIQLEKFSGLEDTMSVELNVETSNGKFVTRTRQLLTTYLPGTNLIYDENKAIDDGYLIQKGTSNNEVKIKIYGYHFNSNPDIQLTWELPIESSYKYVVEDGTINKQKIYKDDEDDPCLIGDYVSHYLIKDFDEIEYNPYDNSYTLTLVLNVSEDIMASFSVSAKLSLTTQDGQIEESSFEENKIIFHPTNYILKSVSISGLANGRKNVAINKTDKLEMLFTTDNENNDLTSEIYQDILKYATEDGVVDSNKLASMFSYYRNGGTITFADNDLHPEFEFNLINKEIMSIFGVSQFTNRVELKIWYGYCKAEDGTYKLQFGEFASQSITTSISCEFILNIFIINEDNEIPIYSAEEIYNSSTGTWNFVEGVKYILMNDIELERVVPITTPIAQLDGNNRVISIKSFAVDNKSSNYGLFGSIGTYNIKDQFTEQTISYPTLLKNVIVDYSKFDGTLAVNNNETGIINFGGLVGTNNGGLIYNCDVVNLNVSTDVQVDIIVPSAASVTFGGLVGNNSGIITNSRVGRDSYKRIVATKTTESTIVKKLGGLTFEIYNSETLSDNNMFNIVAGGLVGVNSGTISTSYVAKTNLVNYSTSETINMTAGFVGQNDSGNSTIAYSFTKADDATITSSNPYSTGYVIENKGNGIVSGFVYENNGTISNSYSNLELKTKSAYISGFVYENNGTISESYAATSMNSGHVDSVAEQPFVGVDNAGNLLSNGALKNTYYLMRSEVDNPYKQGDKDVAFALNLENFTNSENLIGFAFILSNTQSEREQGIWSYYTLSSKKRVLPELMNANVIAHSYRYVVDEEALEQKLDSAVSYTEGSANNPYIIKDVKDYNNVFTKYEQSLKNNVGYFRFINHIDFNNEETAIQTRTNYVLGYDDSLSNNLENTSVSASTKTSVDGNGLTIKGIYLDVDSSVVDKIGLFAEIKNSYVKNLNLEFATPTTGGQFSTTTAIYSGGLAGRIENSVILNINLKGNNTTLVGSNFVGGLAGLISGKSLVYGVETNLYVKAGATESYLYYNESDYKALNIQHSTNLSYEQYLTKLSYAGGVAGVLDLSNRTGLNYNVQFINVRGDQMNSKTFEGKKEANIYAEYAGGVAGYAGKNTSSFRLKYFTGTSESLRGDTAVGGLYGVNLGSILASQVTAVEDVQFKYDTAIGQYIIGLERDDKTKLDVQNSGNLNLLEGYKYVGGLVGVGLNSIIRSSYSKVGITSGEEVGGLIGLSVASVVNYSYSIPYINSYAGYKYVGGLIGSAYGVASRSPSRNSNIANYETLLKLKGVRNQDTDIQFTYSTLMFDKSTFVVPENAVFDYVSANYCDAKTNALTSNSSDNLMYVYSGTINYPGIVLNRTNETNKTAIVELYKLFNVEDPAQVIAFQEVFSGWSVEKYWSLKEEKYFPLLIDKHADNFIEIESQKDLIKIENNPNGKFKIVSNFSITKDANWVINTREPFSGVLLGELQNDSTRPVITIAGLKPNQAGETSGFFKHTAGATISNLEIVWEKPIDLSVGDLTMVSGLSCEDEGSLISNVEVRADGNSDGYIINSDATTISGFGGIVGMSTNTNLLGCNFSGKINATLSDASGVYFGGIVANATTVPTNDEGEEDGGKDSVVVNNCLIGAKEAEKGSKRYATTEFNLEIASGGTSYIGGVVGYANNAAIASCSIGGADYIGEFKTPKFSVEFLAGEHASYFGGVAGYAKDGLLANSNVLSEIKVIGNVAGSSGTGIQVGGLAGFYSIESSSQLTTGISNCAVNSNISTYVDEDNKLLITSSTDENISIVNISSGVAVLEGFATMKQCLFAGSVNTEGSDIPYLYAGGAAARTSKQSLVELEEVTTYTDLIVGSVENEDEAITGTTNLYVGGLIGAANNAQISYCSSWGRVVPITSSVANHIYAGGFVGLIGQESSDDVEFTINNSYTISSIVADSIASSAIAKLHIGAMFGFIDFEKATVTTQENVFYSSDYALCTEENYEEIILGKNLSAEIMISSNIWHKDLQTEDNVKNNLWSSLNVDGMEHRMPYLTALTEILIQFELIDSETLDYAEGKAMRPKRLIDKTAFDNEYTYYLLDKNGNIINQFSNTLNGILIGRNFDKNNQVVIDSISGYASDEGIYNAIIPIVGEHSAISNLHVKLNNAINGVAGNSGIIAGLNKGVIFNCSVQGTGVTIDGSGNLGLMAANNAGLISHSYSSAEIIQSSRIIGGIVHTNNGKLLSNYFTGYINSTGAGIVYASGDGSYAYNNYMGGIITSINKSAFGLIKEGENNFVDKYSDVKSTDSNIEKVSTASLMSGKCGLIGKWYFTVDEEGKFKENNSFGLNYNYPVYRFNKLCSFDSSELIINDMEHQLYTGTGLLDEKGTTNDLNLESRYSALVTKGKENDSIEYYHAYKIPHFGILTSVQALLNKNRNYVIIYNLNGESADGKFEIWKPIGSNEGINDFANQGEIGFHGVVITNKFYNQMTSTATEDSRCLIQNLSDKGLFTNVYDAYFGDIRFGSFQNLKESGALCETTVAETKEKPVFVNNISFDKESIITGFDETDNYYGGLFGEIQQNSTLNIERFSSSYGVNASSSASLKLSGSNKTTVGLISGKSSGTINMRNSSGATGSDESLLIAWFDGNNYAGGLVGHMMGGELNGNGSIVHISRTSIDGVVDKYTTMLGGAVGLTSAKASTISSVTVKMYAPTEGDPIDVNANSFGGIVGKVGSQITLAGTCKLDIQGTQIDFKFNNDATENRFYGLLAGNITDSNSSGVIAETFEVATKNDKLFVVNIQGEDGSQTYEDNLTNCGVGTFVGSQAGDLIITSFKGPQVQLYSKGVPNVGGVAGYYEGGATNIPISDDGSLTDSVKFILIGTSNVGGLFGYCNCNELTTVLSNMSGTSLLNSTSAYSLVVVDGSTNSSSVTHQNYGGLFGRWGGETETSISTYDTDQNIEFTITNKNNIVIGYNEAKYEYTGSSQVSASEQASGSGKAYNIGGVAGKMTVSQTENIVFNNAATIDVINGAGVKTENSISSTKKNSNYSICKTQNVGGVFGLIACQSGTTIKNINNSGTVFGYQNVGGLVGYVGGDIEIDIINDKSVVIESGDLSFDASGVQNATLPVDDDAHLISSGNIYGAINVGGAVGYAGANVELSKIYSQANVYGNTHVGGLVGLAETATITNNYLSGKDNNGKVTGIVKGIYYEIHNTNGETTTYIPTSVGGLVGAAKESTLLHNVVDGVQINSSPEGENGVVISRYENDMLNIKIGGGNDLGSVNSNVEVYDLDTSNNKVEFNAITTGFGGFIGSTDSATIENCVDSLTNKNYLQDISIEAQLGVNVGTFIGAYSYGGTINSGSSNDVVILPALYATDKNGVKAISVDGAYNVGGLIGFINGNGQGAGSSEWNLSNSTIAGDAEIQLQTRMMGMYIGGLVGKTNANTIEKISLLDANVDIKVDSRWSYYIGGLIGRAEVNSAATIANLNNGFDSMILNGDEANNFGGLVGMLKVGENGSGLAVSVTGTHNYPFTINTVENQNYYDGQPTFNATTGQNKNVEIYTQAYYINLDKLTISGSNKKIANNPLNNSEGWHKDYTMFKTMQRCIPKSQNNGANWDAVTVLFDASRIQGVTTKVENDIIECTLYDEEENGNPKAYTKEFVATILIDDQGKYIEWSDFKNTNISEAHQAGLKAAKEEGDEDKRLEAYKKAFLTTLNRYGKAIISALGHLPADINSGSDLVKGFKYQDKTYTFLKEKTFKTDDQSESGSIFEINGFVEESGLIKAHDYGAEGLEMGFWDWFWTILLGVLAAAAAVVLTIYTAGTGVAVVALVFKCIGVGLFYGLSVGLGSYVLFSGILSEKVGQDNSASQYNEKIYNQTEGLFSSVSARTIEFENGKIKGKPDDVEKIGSFVFQPLTIDKPGEYGTKSNYLMPCTIQTIDGDKVATVIKDATKNHDGVLIEYDEIGECYLKDEEGKYDKELNFDVVEKDGQKYIVVPYYIYYEGQYWINMTAAEETEYPTVDLFVRPTIKYTDQYGKEYEEQLTEYAYLEEDYHYIYGSYNRDGNGNITYSFAQTHGNYVVSVDEGGKATVDYDNVTKELKIAGKKTKDLTYVISTYADETALKGTYPHWVEGYDYMVGAYYTINGANFGDKNYVKYAIFTPQKSIDPDRYNSNNKNIDWFSEVTGTDENGNPTYTYYVINSISDTQPSDWDPSNNLGHRYVYPSSFNNPYTTITPANDGKIYIANKSGNGDSFISHQVEYFLYIGGSFKVEKDADNKLKVYTEIEDMAIRFDGGTVEMLSSAIGGCDGETKNGIAWSEEKQIYHAEGGKIYMLNNMFKICDDETSENYGLLCRTDSYYKEADQLGENYNYGKYLTNKNVDLYTRYRYQNYNLEGEFADGYHLILSEYFSNNEKFSGRPNNGKTTTLVESVKVTFGSKADKDIYYREKSDTLACSIKAGFIKQS